MKTIKATCATTECETVFVKRSNRQLYCDTCRKERQRIQYKTWYEAVGRSYYKERYNKCKERDNGSITNEQS